MMVTVIRVVILIVIVTTDIIETTMEIVIYRLFAFCSWLRPLEPATKCCRGSHKQGRSTLVMELWRTLELVSGQPKKLQRPF